MDGGPTHVDTFDPKPMLAKHEGKPIGGGDVSKQSQSTAGRVWLGSPWKFRTTRQERPVGQRPVPAPRPKSPTTCASSGRWSASCRCTGSRTCCCTPAESPAGPRASGRGCRTAWARETDNLPGYVVLNNDWVPNGGLENFGSAFLPAIHQATMLRAKGVPVDNIRAADADEIQRRKLALLREQDAGFAGVAGDRDAIESAIANYETAFRMQAAVPEVADVSRESDRTRHRYGLDSGTTTSATTPLQCLRARRLVEAGVRFVEITCPLTHANNSPWDQHGQIRKYHDENARITDQSVAALISDLKQRGLLETTIVLWAGEMGRTPHTPRVRPDAGRDHHVNGYTLCLAGGGFKGGTAFGETDEFGNSVGGEPADGPRHPRHDPAPARHRPHEADVPLRRPRPPPDRRAWRVVRELSGVRASIADLDARARRRLAPGDRRKHRRAARPPRRTRSVRPTVPTIQTPTPPRTPSGSAVADRSAIPARAASPASSAGSPGLPTAAIASTWNPSGIFNAIRARS